MNLAERAVESRERSVALVIGLGSLLVPLNSTMVAVAIPDILRDFDAGVGAAVWVVLSYLILMASLQPITGKLGDRLGRRPLILWGLFGFAIASLGAALAPNLGFLVACRLGQALAGAVVVPNGGAMLRVFVADDRRGLRFGQLGSAIAVGAAAGPPLGGLLVGLGGWSAIFWVNLPLVAVSLAAGLRVLPAGGGERRGRFDALGAAMLAVLLGGLALVLNQGMAGPGGVAAAGVLGGLAVAFVWHELRHPDPIVQPRFFARPAFSAGTGAVALSNLAMYATLLVIPLLLEQRGWGSGSTGLLLTALAVPMALLAPVGGRFADRSGRRAAGVAGMALLTVGLVWLATTGADVEAGVLVAVLLMAGCGLGLGSAALQAATVEAVGGEDAGMASGAFSTARYMGSIVGTTLLGVLLASGGPGFGAVFAMSAVAATAATLLGFLLPGLAAVRAATAAATR